MRDVDNLSMKSELAEMAHSTSHVCVLVTCTSVFI